MRWGIAALVLLAACGSSGSLNFSKRLSDGASCAELFDIRNEIGATGSLLDRYNEQLREIGCFSSSSQRTDR